MQYFSDNNTANVCIQYIKELTGAGVTPTWCTHTLHISQNTITFASSASYCREEGQKQQ